MKCHPGVSVEWRSLVFPTFDGRRGRARFEGPRVRFPRPSTRLCFMRSREPPQKTRSAINYALTHSDSPIIYTIVIYCFYGFFPAARPERIACFNISMQGANLIPGICTYCSVCLYFEVSSVVREEVINLYLFFMKTIVFIKISSFFVI